MRLRVPAFSVLFCVRTQYAALPRVSLWYLRLFNLLSLDGWASECKFIHWPFTELNHSYYTGNSLSVLHSAPSKPMKIRSATSVHSRPTTQRLTDNTPSCSALGSQLLHRNTGSLALVGPTRNVTGDAMPTSFDVALTQLSFLEFVQRCGRLGCSFSVYSATSLCITRRRCCADCRTM